MNKAHFILGDGVYPYVTGGMEIFNYYLIKRLSKHFLISYSSYKKLDITNTNFHKCLKIKPVKIFFPIQIFIHLLFHRDIKTVVVSYSASSWIIWLIYYITFKILKQNYIVVIHYGKKPETNHKYVYRNFFKSAKKVVSVSYDIKNNYDKLFNIDSTVIFPLVPFEHCTITKKDLRLKYNIPINRTVICMIGSIKDMKNPDTILKCLQKFHLSELQQFNPHVVYAGDGNMVSMLKNFANTYHLENRVTFLGVVPKEHINEIYKLSDIYLIASDFEGTSVSLLEAMFNKIPIIASRVPGIIHTITEGIECLMFQVHNHNELKKCVLDLMNSPDLAYKIAAQAYNHYKYDYNYDCILEKYTKLLS